MWRAAIAHLDDPSRCRTGPDREHYSHAVAEHVRVCIVGAGFSGVGAAIALRRAGVSDLVILERADAVGGAWRANTYPGCACDVQSRLYELAVASSPEWTRTFASQPEIRAYLESVVEIFNLSPSLRLNTALESASWDEAHGRWQVRTSSGEFSADVLISACGGLTEPLIPDVAGAELFEGQTMHTADWDHSVDLRGKRVAVIGTGASAIQVVPAIAGQVEHLVVMQRTPAWVMPRRDKAITEFYRSMLGNMPLVHSLARHASAWARDVQVLSFTRQGFFQAIAERISRRHLARQVPDASLRARLTPHYDIGCKRILVSDDYYPAMNRDNVTVTTALGGFRANAVVDASGTEHEVDAVIWATGFQILEPPLADRIVGESGETLAQAFALNGMGAYKGTCVAGFPNLFMLQGPNTGLGHSSVVLMSEAQIDYLVPAVASGLVFDVDPCRQEAYVRDIDRRLASTVWQKGGCRSWYQNGQGRNVALWPGTTHGFARMMRRFDAEAYRVRQGKEHHASV